MQLVNQKMNVQSTCSKCGAQTDLKDIPTPPLTIPSSTWPYAQKMFPIQRRFGLATWGSGSVNNRSIYNHIIELEDRFPKHDEGGDFLERMTQFIAEYFTGQLLTEWTKAGIKIELQPEDFRPFGFQLVGFTKDANQDPVPHTHLIAIGKTSKIERHENIGCTCSGDLSVVSLLWKTSNVASYGTFSLQDAVDYARFLIRTTADFQRFSGKLPTVGGEIDMALITNRRGFRWIAQKELYRMLDQEGNI